MSKHRFKLEELQTMNDNQILFILVNDRMSEVTNTEAPLYKRLNVMSNRLAEQIQHDISMSKAYKK